MCAPKAPARSVSIALDLITVILCATLSLAARGGPPAVFLSQITSSTPLPNGIELRNGKMLMRITALRDDVLRIRAARDGALAEDASWAVLPEARSASVSVTQQSDGTAAGFRTKCLSVAVELRTGLLTVRDASGKIVEQDAASVTYNGNAFRLYKAMPGDEHYFGLGDKVGDSIAAIRLSRSGIPTPIGSRSQLIHSTRAFRSFSRIARGRQLGR